MLTLWLSWPVGLSVKCPEAHHFVRPSLWCQGKWDLTVFSCVAPSLRNTSMVYRSIDFETESMNKNMTAHAPLHYIWGISASSPTTVNSIEVVLNIMRLVLFISSEDKNRHNMTVGINNHLRTKSICLQKMGILCLCMCDSANYASQSWGHGQT